MKAKYAAQEIEVCSSTVLDLCPEACFSKFPLVVQIDHIIAQADHLAIQRSFKAIDGTVKCMYGLFEIEDGPLLRLVQ